MKSENLYCDYCEKITTHEGIKKEKLNGFQIELGYSNGGWGFRRDIVRKHSVEICDDCFDRVYKKANELAIEIKLCQKK